MRILVFIFFAGILFSCEIASDGSSKKWKFALVSPNYSNIHFNNRIQESESFNVLQYGYLYNGGGVAIGDIDNDGLADIYFSSNMALVRGSSARSVAKGEPGAMRTRRKQSAKTARTTGIDENNLRVKNVSMGNYLFRNADSKIGK